MYYLNIYDALYIFKTMSEFSKVCIIIKGPNEQIKFPVTFYISSQ